MIIGNLGKDPELKYTQSGQAVATFSVAINEKWKNKDGAWQEKTEWVNCVAWAKLAEICGEYLRKGSKVYVEGKLQTRKWQDQSGADRYTTEVVLSEMKMLDGKKENEPSKPESNDYGSDDVPF
jgi:single-strand DNA-binding protein